MKHIKYATWEIIKFIGGLTLIGIVINCLYIFVPPNIQLIIATVMFLGIIIFMWLAIYSTSKKEELNTDKIHSDNNQIEIENIKSLDNKAYQYERLYDLHGKIVWVECLYNKTHSECKIIDAQNARAINIDGVYNGYYDFKDYAEDWLAYERPVV